MTHSIDIAKGRGMLAMEINALSHKVCFVVPDDFGKHFFLVLINIKMCTHGLKFMRRGVKIGKKNFFL